MQETPIAAVAAARRLAAADFAVINQALRLYFIFLTLRCGAVKVRAIFDGAAPAVPDLSGKLMANDAGKQEPPSLDEFSKRLDAKRGERVSEDNRRRGSGAAWGRAMRVSTELLAGLFVGALLGIGLDRWLGTEPWFLLAGIVLGFAAGLRNLTRSLNGSGDNSHGTGEDE